MTVICVFCTVIFAILSVYCKGGIRRTDSFYFLDVSLFIDNEGNNNNEHNDKEDECWTIQITKEQVIAHEGIAKFRVVATHPNAVHISTASTVTVLFNQPVKSANFEGFDVTVSGSTVTLVRQSHGNAYNSLDQYNSNLEVYCDDAEAINTVSYSISCTKDYNVQGGI